MALDVSSIRRQFPYLDRTSGEDTIYLDNAATTQTPRAVIMTMSGYLGRAHGNVHRGQHAETEQSSNAYEAARARVQRFVGAEHADEIIFTKNATEAINLVACAWAARALRPGDHIVLSAAEHHANIVPWQRLLERVPGVEISWLDISEEGLIDPSALARMLEEKPAKLVALTGQSNVLGTRFNLAACAKFAREHGARFLVDAAQLAAHAPIDVRAIGCDFLAFSGHKIYGPTGIGALYASRSLQKEMAPFMGGGGMVQRVTREGFIPADPPARFEAGTPPVAEAIGLAAAIDWQEPFAWADRETHDRLLMTIAMEELGSIAGLQLLGTNDPATTHGCLSFVIDGVHPHDLTDILGQRGIALRAGHHCAQPLHDTLGIPASSRLSTALYTTEDDIRRAAAAIADACTILRR